MKKNKAVLVFLLRFFVSYLILALLYQWYLNKYQQKTPNFQCSPITEQVAENTVDLGNLLNYDFRIEQHPDELSFKLFVKDHYTARIIEGCNSISVIILFWAFIIAFSGKWTITLFYGIFGSIAIYVSNIIRMVFLSVILYKYPEHSDIAHKIIFPAIIYGFVFILWVIWVRYFAINTSKDNA